MPQKPNFESKEIGILGENGTHSKLKNRNSILSRRFGDLYGRRLLSYPGDFGMYDNHTWQLTVFNSKVQT